MVVPPPRSINTPHEAMNKNNIDGRVLIPIRMARVRVQLVEGEVHTTPRRVDVVQRRAGPPHHNNQVK